MHLEFAYATADARSVDARPVRRLLSSLSNVLHIKNYGSRRGSVDYTVAQGSPFDGLRRGRKHGRNGNASGRNQRQELTPITDENAQDFLDNALITLQNWIERPLSVLLSEQQKREEEQRNRR